MAYQMDKKYHDRIEQALTDALFQAALSEDKSTCLFKSAEIGEALINILAFVAHTSDAVNSPTKRRHFGEEIGKRLARRIASMQDVEAAKAINMQTIHLRDLN